MSDFALDPKIEMHTIDEHLIYLAGPVDAVDRADALEWRTKLAAEFDDFPIAFYSPPAAFTIHRLDIFQGDRRIAIVNETALLNSTFVVANMNGPSIGTPLELLAAAQNNIPVISFGGPEATIYKHLLGERHKNLASVPAAIQRALELI